MLLNPINNLKLDSLVHLINLNSTVTSANNPSVIIRLDFNPSLCIGDIISKHQFDVIRPFVGAKFKNASMIL